MIIHRSLSSLLHNKNHHQTLLTVRRFHCHTKNTFQNIRLIIANNTIQHNHNHNKTKFFNLNHKITSKRFLSNKESTSTNNESWWTSASFWGGLGALAGWGMSLSAIYDATTSGPEIISLNMTSVLIIYSSLFARWAYIVKPQNLLLCSCHIANIGAQLNQLRRGVEYKLNDSDNEKEKEDVQKFIYNSMAMVGAGAGCVLLGPAVRNKLISSDLGVVTNIAKADAGPFTVHFWAPMSKWLISGASFVDLHRPTDKISIAQYSALTLTGFFFSRYALLVQPVNYTLCSVNIALFGSSAWHLGRKINADYIQTGKEE